MKTNKINLRNFKNLRGIQINDTVNFSLHIAIARYYFEPLLLRTLPYHIAYHAKNLYLYY